ncbi:hypothetical protein BMS3Abin07_02460 [bacterium BMS3Abin07]|nr:hypothetical protein BMS3Abin07_02460 [bacterium BMS3Abin07]
MKRQISNKILLTAAGYTRNFGGFLAEDMWGKIFNEVKDSPALKSILSNDFDYESIYYKVLDGDYSNDEKETINTAILEAYRKLDVIAQNYVPATNPSKAAILYGAKTIIDRLSRETGQINFLFTLNQDLFVERLISGTNMPITTPCMPRFFIPNSIDSRLPINDAEFKTVPTQDDLDITKHATTLSSKEFHYIKLHGSFGWKSSDGSNKLVIGRNKEIQIADEPLLLWYSDLFKQVLFQEERKLLIIGYGFRDDHINEPIAEAIERHGLKLYIISPKAPIVFKDELIKADHVYGNQIFEGLTGYIRASFKDLFPPDGNDSDSWRELQENFFDD